MLCIMAFNQRNNIPTMNNRGGSIMLWVCERGLMHSYDAIMRKEDYLEILKQNHKTSTRKMKVGGFSQQDNDPKHISNVVTRTKKWKLWIWHHKALTGILYKICGLDWKSVSENKSWWFTAALSGGMSKDSSKVLCSVLKASPNAWLEFKQLNIENMIL